MDVKWVSQENPTSAADALEKSIAKWRFFSYCTKEQFLKRFSNLNRRCGLCHWVDMCCGNCIFASRLYTRVCDENQCPKIFKTAVARANSYFLKEEKAAMRRFHAAARKVFKKLRSLRK